MRSAHEHTSKTSAAAPRPRKHAPLHAVAIFTISTIVYGEFPDGRLGSPEVELRYELPDRDNAPPLNPAAT